MILDIITALVTFFALIVALVCMMQTAAVLRAYPSHPEYFRTPEELSA